MNNGQVPSAMNNGNILKARAQVLAREISGTEAAAELLDIVEFMIGGEYYGIELKFVREIYPLKKITPLFSAPDFIAGIVNVRGEIISVVDMKKFFNLRDMEKNKKPDIIILENKEMTFGLLTDRIIGMDRVDKSSIQSSLPTLTGIREAYLLGIAKGRTAIIDGGRILGDEKMHIDITLIKR